MQRKHLQVQFFTTRPGNRGFLVLTFLRIKHSNILETRVSSFFFMVILLCLPRSLTYGEANVIPQLFDIVEEFFNGNAHGI